MSIGVILIEPRGIWGIPLTRDERLAKVRDCCELALPNDKTERVIEIVEGLDEGERIIVSDTSRFGDATRIYLRR